MAKNWKRKEKISIEELMKIIPGPDLPTGGLLYRFRANGDGEKHDMIRQAYETGNATMVCQAKADMKDIGGGKAAIIITELPYQTQKTTILERIASSRDKFPGLTDVRDESDYKGMRVVFEVARGTDPQDVLDRLFTHTQMRDSLSYNALALVQAENGKSSPKVLTLADILSEFINHRLNVITRRAKFDLDKAEARLHIVEGLLKALSMIDEVVKIIRNSQNTETARTNLMRKLALSEIQAQAILDMPLKRLSSLERNKLEEEKKELKINIGLLKEILRSEEKRLSIVVEETDEIKNKFSSPRKTLIIETEEGHQAKVTVADLVVPSEPQLVCFSQSRVARLNAKDYRESVVKGKVSGRAVDIFIKRETVQPDETLLLITNRGRLWQGNVGRLPQEAGFDDIGLVRNEKVIASGIATPGKSLYLVTRNGNIKRVSVEDCINSRSEATWGMVIGLNGDDELLMAAVGSDQAHILVTTSGTAEITPRTLRFEASSINAQATPSAKGVAAIKMMDDAVIGAALIEPERFKHYMLYLTDKGFTKKVSLEEYPLQGRGGQGVQVWKLNSTTGIITDFTIIPTKGMVDVFSSAYKRIRFVEDEIPQSTRIGKGIDLGAKYNNGELFPGEKAIGVVFAGS